MSATPIRSAEDLLPEPSTAGPRIRIRFRPRDRVLTTDPQEVVLRPLTLSEELDANRVASKGDGDTTESRLIEQIKRAIVTVDGKAPDVVRAEADRVLERMSPRCRQYLQISYAKAFLAEDIDDFFKAQVTLEA